MTKGMKMARLLVHLALAVTTILLREKFAACVFTMLVLLDCLAYGMHDRVEANRKGNIA